MAPSQAEHGVQLNAVWCDATLTVEDIEEQHAGDPDGRRAAVALEPLGAWLAELCDELLADASKSGADRGPRGTG